MAAIAADRFASQPLPPLVAALADTMVVSTPDEARTVPGRQPPPIIGTHDGTFHCDEALACALLKMTPMYQDAVIVRSRDPEILKACNVVVDVGAVYDASQHRYDHHQRDFDGTMSELGHRTKLSSAGLIYRHFGLEVLARLTEQFSGQDKLGGGRAGYHPSQPPQPSASTAVDIEALRRKVYKGFVEHIDGIDNGVEAFSGTRNYDISTTLSDRVGALNPRWNEQSDAKDANARFCAALQLTGGEFAVAVEGYVSSWWPARALVASALDSAAALHPSRQILELQSACPWSAHLFQLEEERADAGDSTLVGSAKYILFPDSKGGGWRIQAVPVEESSFTSRRALPEPWRGVRDQKLSDLTGIEGCVFVHAGGFIGGNMSRDGALAMALKAIAD